MVKISARAMHAPFKEYTWPRGERQCSHLHCSESLLIFWTTVRSLTETRKRFVENGKSPCRVKLYWISRAERRVGSWVVLAAQSPYHVMLWNRWCWRELVLSELNPTGDCIGLLTFRGAISSGCCSKYEAKYVKGVNNTPYWSGACVCPFLYKIDKYMSITTSTSNRSLIPLMSYKRLPWKNWEGVSRDTLNIWISKAF